MGRRDGPPDIVAKVGELDARVRRLESERTLTVVTGAPAAVAPDGAARLDDQNVRLWLRVGGQWRYVALT